jgi:hypothetical protein
VNSAEGKVPLTLTANTSCADLLIQCEYSGDFCNKEMKRFVDNFVSILTKFTYIIHQNIYKFLSFEI